MTMKELNIDLGKSWSEGLTPATTMLDKEKKQYPTFFYEGDEPLDLPGAEGTMVIQYKKVAKSEREDADGDETYSCTIEVQKIISAEADEPVKSTSKQVEDALDKLMKDKMSKKSNSADASGDY